MIYGQDEAVLFPVLELYDTGMMNMYVNILRDEYNQNRLDMKEFMSKYGDFTSPFAKDVEYWDQNTLGPVRELLSEAQSRGIDLTRSAEGRALLANKMQQIPYAELARRRRNAIAGEQYLQNRAALIRQGKYSPEFEKFRLNGLTFENFDSSQGDWTETSPIEYQSLQQFVDPSLAHLTPHDLTKEQVLSFAGQEYDPRYRYKGITRNDLLDSLRTDLPGLAGSPLYDFYKEKAKQRLIAEGKEPTNEAIMEQFVQDAATADAQRMVRPIGSVDDFVKMDLEHQYAKALDDYRTSNDLRLYGEKLRLDNYYNNGGDGSGSNGSATALSLGTEEQVATQQMWNAAMDKSDFSTAYNREKNKAWTLQKNAYSKMNNADKKDARIYGASYRIVQACSNSDGSFNPNNSKNYSKEKYEAALKNINNLGKRKSPEFVAWRNRFENRMKNYSKTADRAWLDMNTTEGRAGYLPQKESELYNNSKTIFDKNNLLNTSDLSNEQRAEMNQSLDYINSPTNKLNKVGRMKKGRYFAPIMMANMTGGRTYKKNSVVRQVLDIIKDAEFDVTPQTVTGREYGAGSIRGKQYNFIKENVLFTGGVKDKLNKLKETDLRKFGILKDGNGNYTIPIMTMVGASQGRADINQKSLKRTTGMKNADVKNRNNQAEQLQKNVNYTEYGRE